MLIAGSRGFSIIELVIGLAILGILIATGIPEFAKFMQNSQIRNGGEAVLQGLNLARAEAIRRNAPVRFQFVTSLTSSCALTTSSLNWVVSQDNPAGACDATPSEGTAPRIVQRQSGQEGTANVVVAASGGSSVTFSGLGRVSVAGITQVDLSSSRGTCEHAGGELRCLRVLLTSGGQAKLCDPKVTDATDPRICA